MIGVGSMGRPYIAAARELGIDIRVVEADSWDGSELGNLAVERMPGLDTGDWAVDEIWSAGAFAAAAQQVPDGVVAFTEPHVLAAALVADGLGLPGPSLHAAVLSRNKALQRACFAAAGLPQPEFILAGDPARALSWAGPRLPVIVKPLSSSGSAGVEMAFDLARLRATLDRRGAGRLLVEQAVDGPEYSWEGFVRDGRILFGTVTAKETTGPPHFVEVAHRGGHRFADPTTDRVVNDLADQVVRAARIRTGPVHLEFRLTAGGPAIMEFAVRTPGDFIFDLVAAAHEFDPYRAVLQLAMGFASDLPTTADPASFPAVWFPTCAPGRVIEVTGLAAVRAHPLVRHAVLDVRAGDVIWPLRSSAQRPGHVRIDAPSPSERDRVLDYVQEHLRIVTRHRT